MSVLISHVNEHFAWVSIVMVNHLGLCRGSMEKHVVAIQFCECQFYACGLFTLGFPQYLNSPTRIDSSSSVSLTLVSHDNNSLPGAADSCASSVRLCVTSRLHMAILRKKPNKWLSEIFIYWNECRSLHFKLTSHFSQPEGTHPCSSSSSPSVYFSVYLFWMSHPSACTDYKAKPVKIASQDQKLALFCEDICAPLSAGGNWEDSVLDQCYSDTWFLPCRGYLNVQIKGARD